MAVSHLKKIARACSIALLTAGDKASKWTPEDRTNWTRAFNALQKLSGHKIMKPISNLGVNPARDMMGGKFKSRLKPGGSKKSEFWDE